MTGIGPLILFPAVFLAIILPLALIPSLVLRLFFGLHSSLQKLVIALILMLPQALLAIVILQNPAFVTYMVWVAPFSLGGVFFWIRATTATGPRFYAIEGSFVLLIELLLVIMTSKI